jgi:hypothetical protein
MHYFVIISENQQNAQVIYIFLIHCTCMHCVVVKFSLKISLLFCFIWLSNLYFRLSVMINFPCIPFPPLPHLIESTLYCHTVLLNTDALCAQVKNSADAE